MVEKEGLSLSSKSIGLIIVVLLAAGGGTVGGVNLSRGVSTEASEGIRTLVDAAFDERASMMTLEEAEARHIKLVRQNHVDTTLVEHGKALQKLQNTVDRNTGTLQAIADRVGVIE